MTEYRCPDCGVTLTDDDMRRTFNLCPGCGIRFGAPRLKFDEQGALRALDAIKPGEPVAIVGGPPART